MQIDFVQDRQLDGLAALMHEMADHYRVPTPPGAMRRHLAQTLLAPGSPVRLVVACPDDAPDTPAGFAAVTLFHSLVDRTPQLAMKELYVAASQRGRGVGAALLRWLARHAIAQGCTRMDWPVDAANAGGLAFYAAQGAKPVPSRLHHRLDAEGLARLAAG